ncbi:MAG: glycosyltransferase [Bacteroidales bacterium]|nr:glycosyltransferase [Bacteroidales bacterium]
MDNERRHIVFLARWYPHRYDPMLGLFVQRHAEAAALYNDISVIYVHPDDGKDVSRNVSIDDETINNVHTIRIYYKKSKSKVLSLFRFFRANKIALKRLPKPDIIHVHVLTRLGLIAWWHKIMHGTPYIITEHWSRYLPGNDFSGVFRKKLTKTIVKHASAVTTVTEILAKAMQDHGLQNKNYVIVPNVVDINAFKPQPHHNEVPKIVHVSCFENKSKNITGLIDALQILEERNINFQFVFIGDGVDFAMIKDYVKKLKHQESIRFTGVLEGQDYIDELSSNDFLVLSSNYETQGVVLLEAFACGMPVVSTNVGGIPEIVNESNGILVPPQDPEKLADAMETMLQTYQNYDANALREGVIKKFSNEFVGKLLNSIYQNTF